MTNKRRETRADLPGRTNVSHADIKQIDETHTERVAKKKWNRGDPDHPGTQKLKNFTPAERRANRRRPYLNKGRRVQKQKRVNHYHEGGGWDYLGIPTTATDILDADHPDFMHSHLMADERQNKVFLKTAQTLTQDWELGPTTDPVMAYIQRQAETMGLGYIPADLGGATGEDIAQLARERTASVWRKLFGPHWDKASACIGMTREASDVLRGAKQLSIRNVHHLRTIQAVLLAHIGGIKEELHEFERELWVAMQHTHDPRLNGEHIQTHDFRYRIREKMKKQVGKYKKWIPKPYYMPLRAISALLHPDLTPQRAKDYETLRRIQKGQISQAWKTFHGKDPQSGERENDLPIDKMSHQLQKYKDEQRESEQRSDH